MFGGGRGGSQTGNQGEPTAHAATLVAVMITEIMQSALRILCWWWWSPSGHQRHGLFAVVGKAIHIPTFPVVGDSMAAAGILVLERVL
jgi:hypothetical protein